MRGVSQNTTSSKVLNQKYSINHSMSAFHNTSLVAEMKSTNERFLIEANPAELVGDMLGIAEDAIMVAYNRNLKYRILFGKTHLL